MIIKPDEIANTCTIFHVLKVNKILLSDLSSLITNSLSIDSFFNSSKILKEAVDLGLIEIKNKYYHITNIGKKLAKMHSYLKPTITDSVKEYMLKYIYLNLEISNLNINEFIIKFYPDTEYNSFICNKNQFTSSTDIKCLLILHRVGFIYYKDDKVIIRNDYIGLLNNLLLSIRKISNNVIVESPINKLIGDITEDIAYEYEKQRLIDSGHPELSNLVQIISKIDFSAGYDITSFLGSGQDYINPIFIEVKGTEKDYIYFYWSKNEQSVATIKNDNYYLYIYTNVDVMRKQAVGPKIISNPIKRLSEIGYIIEPQDLLVKEK